MKFKGLKNQSQECLFREALFQGLAADGSLYVPIDLPRMPQAFIDRLADMSLVEIGATIVSQFIEEIPQAHLQKIIQKTFSFPLPLVKLAENVFLLELFHGPTLAFKDIGARFMAETLAYFLEKEQKKLTILVATSGDTGSAVAHGFYNVPNVEVFILYPAQKISHLQEQQMTTLGNNIHAIKVAGTFDDCQKLVKQSLIDDELKALGHLTTANSINMGRLLPQIIYYFLGIAQLQKQGDMRPPTVVVPSGNFGNLTAAAYAKAMGAPIHQLIAATNSNDIVPLYLQTGVLQPRPSKQTLSNAMDVGDPSNFPRLQALYNNEYSKICKAITGISITDEETLVQIQKTYHAAKYILDPHTAVGVAAANQVQTVPIIVAATAHPGKFPDVIQRALGFNITLPNVLEKLMAKQNINTAMEADYEKWKAFLKEHLK